jgi:multicomponent Na+:H+ antiporter subunit B
VIEFIVYPILALLVTTSIAIAFIRNLWAAVMFTGIYSFLGACWMLILDAPDVAFTEAAVGAGISTILMLATLSLVPSLSTERGSIRDADFQTKAVPMRRVISSLVVVVVTGAILIYGTLDMPAFGSADAPIQTYPNPSFVEKSQSEMGEHGLPNVVTAVLGSYRGYDTLGETAVIFTAGIAVLLILRKNKDSDLLAAGNEQSNDQGPVA